MSFVLVAMVLFVALSPGVLLSIPPVGKRFFRTGKTSVKAAIVHAVVLGLILYFVRRSYEGFSASASGSSASKAAGSATASMRSTNITIEPRYGSIGPTYVPQSEPTYVSQGPTGMVNNGVVRLFDQFVRQPMQVAGEYITSTLRPGPSPPPDGNFVYGMASTPGPEPAKPGPEPAMSYAMASKPGPVKPAPKDKMTGIFTAKPSNKRHNCTCTEM